MIELKNGVINKNPSSDLIGSVNALKYFASMGDSFAVETCFDGMEGMNQKTKTNFLMAVHSLPIKRNLLNQNEVSVLNLIRETINPRSGNMCGTDPCSKDNIVLESVRLNPANKWKYEIRACVGLHVTCDLNTIDCTLSGGNMTNPIEFTLTRNGVISEKMVYSYAKLLMTEEPSGEFNIVVSCKNKKDIEIELLNYDFTFK